MKFKVVGQHILTGIILLLLIMSLGESDRYVYREIVYWTYFLGLLPGLVSAIAYKWFSATLSWGIFSAMFVLLFSQVESKLFSYLKWKIISSIIIGTFVTFIGNQLGNIYFLFICYLVPFIYLICMDPIACVLFLLIFGYLSVLSFSIRFVVLLILDFIC